MFTLIKSVDMSSIFLLSCSMSWGDCSFRWYWRNCWPSLFKLPFLIDAKLSGQIAVNACISNKDENKITYLLTTVGQNCTNSLVISEETSSCKINMSHILNNTLKHTLIYLINDLEIPPFFIFTNDNICYLSNKRDTNTLSLISNVILHWRDLVKTFQVLASMHYSKQKQKKNHNW
jgi:hypothetical protein